MAEYANVGGKQVLVCDIEEWLQNRGLVAVPGCATPEMLRAAVGWREADSVEGAVDEIDMFDRAYRAMIVARPLLLQKEQAP